MHTVMLGAPSPKPETNRRKLMSEMRRKLYNLRVAINNNPEAKEALDEYLRPRLFFWRKHDSILILNCIWKGTSADSPKMPLRKLGKIEKAVNNYSKAVFGEDFDPKGKVFIYK